MGIDQILAKYNPDVLRVRRHLHMYPELSLKEYETSKYLQEELKQHGIPFQVIEGRSIVATIEGGRPGQTLALRGDMDALPLQEQAEFPCRSQVPGVMHACGHDCHAAMALGTALVLNELKDQLNGTLKVIFQEGEEVGLGALTVLASGLLDDVDNSLSIHLIPHRDTGTFVTRYGLFCAKYAWAEITVLGKKSHAGTPHLAINPILLAAEIIGAVSSFLAYEIPSDGQVLASPTIISGGDTANIIPDRCTITYNLRYFEDKYDTLIPERLQEIATGIAGGRGAKIDLQYGAESLPMYNEQESTDRAVRVVKKHFGEDKLLLTPPELFSDDFAYIQQQFPGVMMNLGMAKNGCYTSGHNGNYFVDEASLEIGLKYLVHYCLDYFGLE